MKVRVIESLTISGRPELAVQVKRAFRKWKTVYTFLYKDVQRAETAARILANPDVLGEFTK